MTSHIIMIITGILADMAATWTHGATLMGADLTMDTTPPMAIPMGMDLARMTAWSSACWGPSACWPLPLARHSASLSATR